MYVYKINLKTNNALRKILNNRAFKQKNAHNNYVTDYEKMINATSS